MLYQSNRRTEESKIDPMAIMIMCDRCWGIMTYVRKESKEVIAYGKEKENVCLYCKKKERG